MFKNCKKNDELFFVGYSSKGNEGLKVIVTKVNDEFIYVKSVSIYNYETKHKFRIENGFEVVKFGGSGKLYLSEQEYFDYLDSIKIKKYIERTINDSRIKISLSDLKLIEQILINSK